MRPTARQSRSSSWRFRSFENWWWWSTTINSTTQLRALGPATTALLASRLTGWPSRRKPSVSTGEWKAYFYTARLRTGFGMPERESFVI